MNLLPTRTNLVVALQEEFSSIEAKIVESYFRFSLVNRAEQVETTGYTIYEYEDSDIDEIIYMCVMWTFNTETNQIEFGDQIEEGGFDMIEEAVNLLKSKFKVKLLH